MASSTDQPSALNSNPAPQSTISHAAADASLLTTGSRLESVWKDHLEQYRRVDDLEKRIAEHAVRLRRRVTNLLETEPSHRLSHLRLFVSHHDRSPASNALVAKHATSAAVAAATAAAATGPEDKIDSGSRKWTLAIEGKLLIDHLDHESVKKFDERLKQEFQKRHNVKADHSSLSIATSQNTTNTSPTEDEDKLNPLKFTHFFDKVVVQFQSVYQPIIESTAQNNNSTAGAGAAATPKASPPMSGKKKSRSIKRQKTSAAAAAAAAEVEEPAPVDPRLCTFSDPDEYTWNKTITTITNATAGDGKTAGKPAGIVTSTTTKDAHAFFIHYESPPPPASAGTQLYGAIATVQLYPSRGPDQRYKPSKEFAKAFFPKHIVVVAPPALPTTSIAEAKKADVDQDADDSNSATPSKYKRRTSSTPSHQTGHNALENEIHVPTSLTMHEILTSVYTYIKDHKLTATDEPTLVQNDKKLEALFQCESMQFHELQTLLMQSRLVILLPKPAPIVLKYVLKADALTATPGGGITGIGATGDAVEDPDAIVAAPMTMDLHNDVYVPNLFPNRARECLRRIKHRELDYTGSRTKARYLLMASKAKDESAVKAKIEEAICGTSIGEWPILAALAKAAAPHSEARAVCQLDAKIAYLLEQVETSQQAAHQAWDFVDLCRDMGSAAPDDDALVVDQKGDNEDASKPTAATEANEQQGEQAGDDAMEIDTPAKATNEDSEQANI